MATTQHKLTSPPNILTKLHTFLDAVKFEHSIFALPFAYMGMVLAADGFPTLSQFIWITVAMVGARTLAMSSNRLIDVRMDAMNPRTAKRALPAGKLKPWEMLALAIVSLAVFIGAASQLNTLALALAPVAAIVVVGYSYVKRFSWTTHFVLGWADAIAPAGGWIAVTGALPWEAVLLSLAVAAWIGGFDIFYACQDYEFDKKHGVHSIPQRFGIRAALWWARGMHLVTSGSLLGLGIWMGLHPVYYMGWFIASTLLVYEHRLVKPNDLSRLNMAFFNVNGYIAVVVFAFTLTAVLIGG